MYKKIILVIIFSLITFSQAYAKHIEINITGCSERTIQEIKYVQNNLESKGYVVTANLTCDDKFAEKLYNLGNSKRLPFKDICGFYYYPSDIIYVNQHTKTMSVPRILLHELGHHNHRLTMGTENWDNVDDISVPKHLKNNIIIYISNYATTSRKEFVAEYYSLTQLTGEKFPKEIQDFYEECGGP